MKISIIAHPNSRKPRVENDLLGELHIYVREPPLDGKANSAVISALSNHLKVNKSQIRLIHGIKSKNKMFEIS